MHRFFVEGAHEAGDRVVFGEGDARKIALVLRLVAGDVVEVIDSGGRAFRCALAYEREAASGTLLEELPATHDAPVPIDVAQALPKGQKMDFVVEKLIELGVRSVLPFYSERSVPREAGAAKVERWRRLARSAALQCGRRDVPQVAAPGSFDETTRRFEEYGAVLFAWETVRERRLRDELPRLIGGAASILVVVGPEGGFSHDEADAAIAAGAHPVSLGPRILRTETAAMSLTSVLQYLLQS